MIANSILAMSSLTMSQVLLFVTVNCTLSRVVVDTRSCIVIKQWVFLSACHRSFLVVSRAAAANSLLSDKCYNIVNSYVLCNLLPDLCIVYVDVLLCGY